MKTTVTFGKEQTAIIKGFAIIFMIVHHLTWAAGCMDMTLSPLVSRILASFKLCVLIFLFLIGYGYSFAKEKSFRYSFRHVKKLLGSYWVILFVLALPAGVEYVKGGKMILLNMIGIDETVLWVSWFVYLYIWTMIVMPFIGRLIDRKPLVWSLFFMAVFAAALVLYKYLCPQYADNSWTLALFNCLMQTPLVILGYLFGRLRLFERLQVPTNGFSLVIATIGIVASLGMRMLSLGTIPEFLLSFIEPVLCIFCILVLFRSGMEFNIFSRFFGELGDKSVYMWFIHPLFFVPMTTAVYGRLVLISSSLWIVGIWTIVLSYIFACIIKSVVEY